jgi:N-acetylmuramoyl-L-alanine amidase CwlA
MSSWIASPNFSPGRDGHSMTLAPSYIVLHTTVGSKQAAIARFVNGDPNQRGGRASAHYIVGLDGSLTQMVREEDAAWHAGNYEINLDSIGIEHEDGGDYNGPRTDALYAASSQLVREIVARYPKALSIDRAHIRKHKEVSDAPTACPDALDVDRILRQAAAPQGAPTVNPANLLDQVRAQRDQAWMRLEQIRQLSTGDGAGGPNPPRL